MAQENRVKKSHSEERKGPYIRESSHTNQSKTTEKTIRVDKDLTKSPKKKCFEENGAV